ncbi:hypothetical protein [Paenibacillus sp. L3-i20]|uniref:hypothetical protein n=1 Tax=Paenibacillus sp. L3-i20 TaxID=2905833 RepID=UPI0028528FFA|nr:hypothetical protein [Paenibacillus sp. L3-i20]
MMESITILERARQFIYNNARLIDRQRFSYFFEDGSQDAVLKALQAYQNADGGFGNGLEPDIRCPHSQPVPTEVALHTMDAIGAIDTKIMDGIFRYLEHITLKEGGLPLAFRNLLDFPHAPWWNIESDDIASLNPTGNIVALLLKLKVGPDLLKEAWFSRNAEYVWQSIEHREPTEYHDVVQWISFLEQAPDQARAIPVKKRLDEWLAKPGVIERDPYAEGYVQKVLDYVSSPTSYARKFVTDEEIELHLDALIEQQQEDGGWLISFPETSSIAGLEWRGSLTVDRLVTLRAFGRI